MKVNVFNDGKWTRDEPAKILKVRAKSLLIEFYCNWKEETLTDWFYRECKSGSYESRNYNYFYFTQRYQNRHWESFQVEQLKEGK